MLCENIKLPTKLNSKLQLLQPYPHEKLRCLFENIAANPHLNPIDLSVGEPKHPTPEFIREILNAGLSGFANYPSIAGSHSLRQAIADWAMRRYQINNINPETQVIATLGSREALFSLAQTVLDDVSDDGLVLCPNPFYQIYEGSALLAGAQPYFINTTPDNHFKLHWSSIPDHIWRKVQLVFTCSPGNPSGAVISLDEWRELFALSDRYGFVIAADECYTEIYFDEKNPPLGALQAAQILGRHEYQRLIILGSLSKRSNVPGMRSGYAVGDAAIINQFLHYRTYHGSAMGGLIQMVSEALWKDDTHVKQNRHKYAENFSRFQYIVNPVLPLQKPEASFYYWIHTPIDDKEFALRLRRDENVSVLPGSLLARNAHGINPGKNFIRVALVSRLAESNEAAHRIRRFSKKLQ